MTFREGKMMQKALGWQDSLAVAAFVLWQAEQTRGQTL